MNLHQAIISVAHSLKLEVIADGVESAAQLTYLAQILMTDSATDGFERWRRMTCRWCCAITICRK